MKLLTAAAANAKTSKNIAVGEGRYLSYILHLAPEKLSGYNVCPAASAGCAAGCLNKAGRGRFTKTQEARIRKTRYFFEQRGQFLADLIKDLDAVCRKATREGKRPVVRLNGTSDIPWERVRTDNGQTLIERYATIQFYEYTKLVPRLERLAVEPIPNYHLTFSRSEKNGPDCERAIALGFNVAAVFGIDTPRKWAGRPVVDGDNHDLRFLDPKPADGRGAVIALRPKGPAKKDTSGFVIWGRCRPKAA